MKILEMKSISKAFGGEQALKEVHFSVDQGTVHALLGENGAGKSTLMNILTGVIQGDTGQIIFEEKHYHSPSINQMEKAGIAFVHQEINVVNDLMVYENIFLSKELTNQFGLLEKKKMIQETKNLFANLGVFIDPSVMVSELETSQKQLLEICRALYQNAKLLILDEPTTALNTKEVEQLFKIINKLKSDGKSFIFISHKMPEVFEIADAYTVLRNGEFISSGKLKDTTPYQIASDMVGVKYVDKDYYIKRKLGDTILELVDFTGIGFYNVNLQVKKGEIIAFTGLAGSGASEVLQTMFGVLPIEGGYVSLHGKPIRGKIKRFMKNGIGMLPSNRKENSVIQDMNILENMNIAEHNLTIKNQLIKNSKELIKYENLKQMLWIKAGDSKNYITSLSGGNQQKVFFARWLNTRADVLLFDNPTQGVDIGAKVEIYKLILALAEEGKTIIINTLEIPEIMKVSDRCAIFFEGRLVKVLDHDDISEHKVMLYSTDAINAGGGEAHEEAINDGLEKI